MNRPILLLAYRRMAARFGQKHKNSLSNALAGGPENRFRQGSLHRDKSTSSQNLFLYRDSIKDTGLFDGNRKVPLPKSVK